MTIYEIFVYLTIMPMKQQFPFTSILLRGHLLGPIWWYNKCPVEGGGIEFLPSILSHLGHDGFMAKWIANPALARRF
ncbi:hypothetical protein CEXT_796841 [Caerostris extrusa]|uniref:Uncharacterized protein n=1 Tax=Caerostris extrusa TaxID=172846 RepID=A0AAV4X9P0_CAEEX|nr:hypothetical protein CEXT_796841 [Caerostris extrusa]